MGDKSEAFCRLAVQTLKQNQGVLPRNFDVDEYVADMDALDALRQRRIRINQIAEKLNDTEMALGSDVMVASLEGYGYLKVAGKSLGLDDLRNQLSARFKTGPRRVAPPAGQ